MNTLFNKQLVTELDTKNNLDTFYNSMTVTTEQQSAQPVSPAMTRSNNGVAVDELPHIDVVTDSFKRNILPENMSTWHA